MIQVVFCVFLGFFETKERKRRREKDQKGKESERRKRHLRPPTLIGENTSLDFPVGKSGNGVKGVETTQKQEHLSTGQHKACTGVILLFHYFPLKKNL